MGFGAAPTVTEEIIVIVYEYTVGIAKWEDLAHPLFALSTPAEATWQFQEDLENPGHLLYALP